MATQPKKYVIMCVGHTHSGKTTFAKKMAKAIPSIISIDSDEISRFINEKYQLVASSKYNQAKRSLRDPNLKLLLWKDIYDFSLNTELSVVLSNGNLAKDIRELIARKAKRNGYNLITIFFNLDDDVIIERIRNTKKSTKVFVRSKNWNEALNSQKKYAELPPSKKNTIYFEINKTADYKIVADEVKKLLS